VRLFVTAAGAEPYHDAQRDYFRSLAALDEVGQHELVADVDDADAVLFVDLQQHPDDIFLRVLRRHPLVRRYPGRVYVYDERDYPFVTFPGVYVSGTPRFAKGRPVVGGAYPSLPTTMRLDDRSPDLLFSFSGARTHPVRSAVLGLEHPRSFVRDTSAINFFSWVNNAGNDLHIAARSEYAAIVSRSKFVLCPRGHSPSSFRLYETLSAGRVPVVISDDWLAPPRIEWQSCVVRVLERDVSRIPVLLDALEPRWPQMASAAARTFDDHFSPSRLWHHYAESIAQLAGTKRRWPWWAQRQVLRVSARHVRGIALQAKDR
jgi:hypothetical protein